MGWLITITVSEWTELLRVATVKRLSKSEFRLMRHELPRLGIVQPELVHTGSAGYGRDRRERLEARMRGKCRPAS
jgi:hypothetical protein